MEAGALQGDDYCQMFLSVDMGECNGCPDYARRIEVYSNRDTGCGDEFYRDNNNDDEDNKNDDEEDEDTNDDDNSGGGDGDGGSSGGDGQSDSNDNSGVPPIEEG